MFNIVFHEPEIPGNSGSTIRLSAVTGSTLHLIEPLGFDLDEKKVKRAGLDYHDLAAMKVHATIDEFFAQFPTQRVYAFSGQGETLYSDVDYQPGDVLLFGKESVGLSEAALQHPRVTEIVRIPMTSGTRSLNLATSAALVTYEAWRQNGFAGSLDTASSEKSEPFIYPNQQ